MKQTPFLSKLKNLAPFVAAFLLACVLSGAWLFWLIKKYSFQNPVYLYLIFVLLFIAALAAAFKNFYAPAFNYPVPQGVEVKNSLGVNLAQWLPFCFLVAALVCAAVALARPRYEGRQALPPTKGIDIMMTIDVSGSMEANDLPPNRLAVAKAAAVNFVKGRVSDRIGVVAFAGYAALQCPLTLDYFAVYDYIKFISIGMMDDSGTAVGDAIAVSVKHLKESTTKSKVIILVTDGESNSGTVDPLAAAKAAASYGIKVYTIGVSGDGAAKVNRQTVFGVQQLSVPALTAQAQKTLKEISGITGGLFFRAKNNDELFRIYEEINKLETTDFKETVYINYEDRYLPFLYAAIAFLLLSLIADKALFIKIP